MNTKFTESVIYNNRTTGRRLFSTFNYIFLSILTVVSVVPIINILCMSVSSNQYVAAGKVGLWPMGFTFEAYMRIIKNDMFISSLTISIERSILGVVLTMICTILAAYPLSLEKREFRARGFFVWFFMISMLFNGGLIPWYMIVRETGLYDTIFALVIPSAFSFFYVLLLMNFFRTLPKEIAESASIDGASRLRTLLSIILPVSTPVLATLVLFIFVNHWNSWFDGFIFMKTPKGYPLQTYLFTVLTIPDTSMMTGEEISAFFSVNQRSIKAAEIFVATVPIFLLYPFLQRYFTKGIVLGSVKG